MAEKKVQHSDIFADDLFLKTQQDAEKFLHTIQGVKGGIKDLLAETRVFIQGANLDTSKGITEFNAKIKERIALTNQLDILTKEEIETAKKLEQLKGQELKNLAKAEALKQKQIKTTVAEIKAEQDLKKAIDLENKSNEKKIKQAQESQREYVKLSRQLTENKKKVKDLLASNRELTEQDKELIKSTQELDARLKEIDKTVGDNQRNVGNYGAAIRDALGDTGIFNNGIGSLIITLRNLQKQQEETGGSSSKLGNILKITGVGIIIASIGLVVKGLTALKDVSQDLTDLYDRKVAVAGARALAGGIKLFGDAANNAAKATNDYFDALISSRKVLRDLSIGVQKTSMDLEDQNEITNDATISTTERNKALEESIRLTDIKTKKELLVAQISFNVAQKELKAQEALSKEGNARVEFYDRFIAAEKELLTAQDNLGDLERINAERRRKIEQEQIINNVEILRSNKLSANARVVELEKSLSDEKLQLEERKKIAKELSDTNRKTINAEFTELQKGISEKIDVQKLLSIQDEVLLKDFIRRNIASIEGTSIETTLLKVIKQGQESQIKNNETKKKQEEEEIKRGQKIAEIKNDIQRIQLEGELSDIQRSDNERQLKRDRLNEKLSQGQGVFNRKLLAQRKASQALEEGILLSRFDKQKEILEKRADIEKSAIENSIQDEKVKAAEIIRINKKLDIDLRGLQTDRTLEINKLEEKNRKEDEAIALKQRTELFEKSKEITNLVESSLNRRSDREQQALDRGILQQEINIEKQQSLAERGLENTLAFEEKKRSEDELKKEQLREKDERRAKVLAYLNAVIEYAKQDPNSAPFKALATVAIAEAISGAFKDGVEGFKGKGTDTSDSNLVLLSNNESVITAKGTRENTGLATAMNEGKVKEYFIDKYNPKIALDAPMSGVNWGQPNNNTRELKELSNKLDVLNNTLRGKKEMSINWNNHGEMTVREVENGVRRVINYAKKKPKI